MLLDKTIAGCIDDEVPEIRRLGDTLTQWRTEILAHHDTGARNGPTEGLNLCVKKVKRCGHGFRTLRALPAPRAAPHRRRPYIPLTATGRRRLGTPTEVPGTGSTRTAPST